MDCRKAERSVTKFIRDEMDNSELGEFVRHINACKSCKEELAIQYLILEGMTRLEEGKTFALQEELQAKLEQARRKAAIYSLGKRILYATEAAILIAAVIWMVVIIISH